MKKPNALTLTYQERLELTPEEINFLTELMATYQLHKRCLWQGLYGRPPELRPIDLNAYKREFCERHAISSTAYNSLKNEVDGLFKAQCELLGTRQVELKAKVHSVRAWIDRQKEVVARSLANILKLESEHQTKERLKIEATRFKISHKSRKLAETQRKLEAVEVALALGKSWQPAVAFGSKKLLRSQHELEGNGYKDHAAWKEDFDFSRSSSVFFLGDQGEKSRNREVKGIETLLQNPNSDLVNLRLVIPEHLRAAHDHKATFVLSPVKLSPRTLAAVMEALQAQYHKVVRKNGLTIVKDMQLPVSYRLLRRKRVKTLKDGTKVTTVVFYLQIILQKLAESYVSTPEAGAIGVDQNLDHIAVGVVDRFGNPSASFTIPFRPYENSALQNKALIGAITADIVDLAEALQVPVIAEKLNFKRKMATLKESYGPAVNHRFSAFSYNAVDTALRSRCFKQKIQFIPVEPAYSSMIGAMNYLSMKDCISSHEAACFTLARRCLNYSD